MLQHPALQELYRPSKEAITKEWLQDFNLDHLLNKNNPSNKKDKEVTCLTLDFISDRHSRHVREIIKRYDFPIRVTFKPAHFLKIALKNKMKTKHINCKICDILPDNLSCNDRFLVYQFTCWLCKAVYIGETCRPFNRRYKEHQKSLEKQDDKSALSSHVKTAHSGDVLTIASFDLQIMRKCSSPMATRLAEVRSIIDSRPSLNRKHEIAAL